MYHYLRCLALFFLLMVCSASELASANARDRARLRLQYVNAVLGSFVGVFAAESVIAQSAVVRGRTTSLPARVEKLRASYAELAVEEQTFLFWLAEFSGSELVFKSGGDEPNFFRLDGQIRVAKVDAFETSPIYINEDLITREINGEKEPLSIGEAIAILIHEYGHLWCQIRDLDRLNARPAEMKPFEAWMPRVSAPQHFSHEQLDRFGSRIREFIDIPFKALDFGSAAPYPRLPYGAALHLEIMGAETAHSGSDGFIRSRVFMDLGSSMPYVPGHWFAGVFVCPDPPYFQPKANSIDGDYPRFEVLNLRWEKWSIEGDTLKLTIAGTLNQRCTNAPEDQRVYGTRFRSQWLFRIFPDGSLRWAGATTQHSPHKAGRLTW